MGSMEMIEVSLKTEKDSDLVGKLLCLSARRVKRGGVEPRKWSGIEIRENGRLSGLETIQT